MRVLCTLWDSWYKPRNQEQTNKPRTNQETNSKFSRLHVLFTLGQDVLPLLPPPLLPPPLLPPPLLPPLDGPQILSPRRAFPHMIGQSLATLLYWQSLDGLRRQLRLSLWNKSWTKKHKFIFYNGSILLMQHVVITVATKKVGFFVYLSTLSISNDRVQMNSYSITRKNYLQSEWWTSSVAFSVQK